MKGTFIVTIDTQKGEPMLTAQELQMAIASVGMNWWIHPCVKVEEVSGGLTPLQKKQLDEISHLIADGYSALESHGYLTDLEMEYLKRRVENRDYLVREGGGKEKR